MLRLQQALFQMEQLSGEEKWSEILALLEENALLDSNHVDIINTLANIYVIQGENPKAWEVIQRGLQKHAFHVDVNYNAGVIYYIAEDYEKSLYYFSWFQNLKKKNTEAAASYIEDLKQKLDKEIYDRVIKIVINMKENMFLNFPGRIDNEHLVYFGDCFSIQNDNYYVGLYSKTLRKSWMYVQECPAEVLLGEKRREMELDCLEKIVLPFMLLNEGQQLEIQCNNQKQTLQATRISQFHSQFRYHTFQKGDSVKLVSDQDFVIGNPIQLCADEAKPKLVLNIFVDGLSQMFLDAEGLNKVMPNTARFFQKGTICTNAHAVGEWTYVSVANYFSGKYTMHHRQYHPDHSSTVLHSQTLFPEVFQDCGYFCSKIDGDWRSVPLSGYAKGMDRILYHHGYFGMFTEQVLYEAMEHLNAFQEKNNFLWICLPDLHDVADEFDLPTSVQVATDFENRVLEKTEATSARKGYDPSKIAQYRQQLKRMDMLLESMYHYIEQHYAEDEYMVSLFSDHGQSYLKDTENFLDVHRTHVPMMFRGRNIPVGICDEWIQSVDLFPTILHCLGESADFSHDGNVPTWFGGEKERTYAFAESLFPDSPYRVTFIEKELKIFFESKGYCTDDGRIPFSAGFQVKVLDKSTDEELSGCEEKIKQYEQILLEHIQEYLIY